MFKKIMKAFLITFFSLFFFAACVRTPSTHSPSTSTSSVESTSSTDNTVTLDGKWEAIEFRNTIERSLGYIDMADSHASRLIYSDAMKDVAPTLTISEDQVSFEYRLEMKPLIDNYYAYKEKDPKEPITISKEEFTTNLLNNFKGIFDKYKHHKVELDRDKLTAHSVLKDGILNETDKTIFFLETPNILGLAIVGGADVRYPVFYHYELVGDILTLTLETKSATEDEFPMYFEMKFKKVAEDNK